MGIAIGADERGDLNAVAAHGLDHVAENTEAGDDLERRIGGLRAGAGEDGGAEREGGNGAEFQKATTREHGSRLLVAAGSGFEVASTVKARRARRRAPPASTEIPQNPPAIRMIAGPEGKFAW